MAVTIAGAAYGRIDADHTLVLRRLSALAVPALLVITAMFHHPDDAASVLVVVAIGLAHAQSLVTGSAREMRQAAHGSSPTGVSSLLR